MSFRSIGSAIARAVAEQLEGEPALAPAWMDGGFLLQQPRFMRALAERASDLVRDGMGPDTTVTCHACGEAPDDVAAHLLSCALHPLSVASARIGELEAAEVETQASYAGVVAERGALAARVAHLEAAIKEELRWLDREDRDVLALAPGANGILRKLRARTGL